MSVDLLPILIDEKILSDEIARLRKTLPPEKLDSGETQFHDSLFYSAGGGSSRNQYTYPKMDPAYKNTRWCSDADSIRFQLLKKARESIASSGQLERDADALYQFLGAFFCCYTTANPINEFGFRNSAIISVANSRRLHLLFQQINFDLLKPLFDEHCRPPDNGTEYTYIDSFEKLVEYASALDGLVIEAIDKDKMIYIWAG